MRFEHDGTSLWYGTTDAPAPSGAVGPNDSRTVTVAVHPIDAGNKVNILYRVNSNDAVREVNASWLWNDNHQDIQYFRAALPDFQTGDHVEYTAVCSRAGRQVPTSASTQPWPATFQVSRDKEHSPHEATLHKATMAPSPVYQQIEILRAKLQEDPSFSQLLELSLQKAYTIAREELDRGLLEALIWPFTCESYLSWLATFAQWRPQQSGGPPWNDPGTDESQEVYDRLCHFYWLIDQNVLPGGSTIVQDNPWFAEWLVGYADDWGSFLDTPDSFNQAILDSFIEYSPKYRVEDSMIGHPPRPNAPSGWLTFNQFFARELNPGLRPIANPTDNATVTSPADCTFRAMYPVAGDSTIPEITVKKTHRFASVEDLLEGSRYKSAFANGTFVHYFLGPYSYHRFHTPVAGIVRECYPVRGLVYLDVNISDNQFDAPDSAQGGYQFAQARGIISIDTKDSPFGDVGIVTVVPVGMAQVSSVNMTATVGSHLLKGDEFGYFLFGGSDIIVLFQAGANPQVDRGTNYRHYGTPIATCTRK